MLRSIIRFILGVIIALILALAAVFLLGSRLSRTHTAEESIVLAASPQTVFDLLDKVSDYPEWRPSVTRVEMLPAIDNQTHWMEIARAGNIPYVVIVENPPSVRITRIAADNLGFAGTWTFSIVPRGSGSVLTIRENAEISNPFFRFYARYVTGYSATIHQFLLDVANKVGRA
jgi:hypothetical protein